MPLHSRVFALDEMLPIQHQAVELVDAIILLAKLLHVFSELTDPAVQISLRIKSLS